MNSIEFTEQFLLKEVEAIEAANVRLHLLSAIVHGIETAGALLDSKPFKAKGQGQARFNLAIKKLFPASYIQANSHLNLYSQLRSHVAHCMLPAKTIEVHLNNAPHLLFENGKVHLSLPILFKDYQTAMRELLRLLKLGDLKNKRIVFDNLENLQTERKRPFH